MMKQTELLQDEYIPVYYKDWFPTINQAIEVDWNDEWERKKQKMYEITKKVGPWRDRKKSHKARRGSAEQIKERTHAPDTRLPNGEQRTESTTDLSIL